MREQKFGRGKSLDKTFLNADAVIFRGITYKEH
jgi:hypothetical protein